MKSFEESTEFEELYNSMWKCIRGKTWKASVARYLNHGIEETLKLEEAIATGHYLPRKPHEFTLFYPKLRPCSSIHIRDRIVQRSVNDNILYPVMTNSLIYENMACQTGKGTTAAMDLLTKQLHRYFINNGNSNEGFILQADIHGYYRSINHDLAEDCFHRRLDDITYDHIIQWLHRQYPGEIGYSPGSQMVQILGISFPDKLDHKVKERGGVKLYARYMDDFYIISPSKEKLQELRKKIEGTVAELQLELHPKKTRIYRISDGIKYLGFTFRLTKTGKVVRILDPNNVKHERKKLVRMARLVAEGKRTKEQYYKGLEAWIAHAELGNSYKLICRMREFAKITLEEAYKNVQVYQGSRQDNRPDQR